MFVLLPVCMFQQLHLVFNAKFKFLQTHLFQFFLFGEISFLDEGIETLRVLRVFLCQPAKFFVAGHKVIFDLSRHPEKPPDHRFDLEDRLLKEG